jgi:hypothetical protein
MWSNRRWVRSLDTENRTVNRRPWTLTPLDTIVADQHPRPGADAAIAAVLAGALIFWGYRRAAMKVKALRTPDPMA